MNFCQNYRNTNNIIRILEVNNIIKLQGKIRKEKKNINKKNQNIKRN